MVSTVNNIKNNNVRISECADRLIKKIEEIRWLCPKAKLTINPILPSKSHPLNTKAKQFNRMIFDYMNQQHDHLLQKLNFDVFVDGKSGLLRNDLGRFNSYDFIHLGKAGIILLIKLVKERVCGYRVDGRPYSGVSSMNRESVNAVRNVDSVNSGRVNVSRVGGESMMAAPITTSDTPSSPSKQIQS